VQVIYYYNDPPQTFSKSIFLAGPSPRTPETKSWRPEALRILEAKRFDGVVYVPEPINGNDKSKYDWERAPKWEHKMIDVSDVVLFWIPRDIKPGENGEPILPGFTTNVEYGWLCNSGKVVLGCPPNAPKTRYLTNTMAGRFHVPVFDSLETTIDKALAMIGEGAERTGGERQIPLFIWRHRAFQNWYQAQTGAGNRLDGASVEWLSRVTSKPEAVFAFAIRPNVYIASENRNKVNDPVVFRLDISSVVLYRKRTNLLDTEIVIIREFRSAASTQDGFIWELPGGSSPFITDPLEVAVEEVKEEVGLEIASSRLAYVGSRQMAGTLSEHKSHTYAAELTEDELAWLKTQKDIPHGSDYPHNPTGERAYTEVLTLREIADRGLADWANYGMICEVIFRTGSQNG